jgi:hypothetical protein
LEAYGSIVSKSEILYFAIHIGTPQEPFNIQNKFSIKLKNGEKVASSDFSLDFVLKHYTSKYNLSEEEKKNDLSENKKWGSKAVRYYFDGVSFIFSEKKLLFFNVLHDPYKEIEPEIEIGDAEMKIFYKLPIRQQDLEKIFGCPNKVADKMIL